jgi:two-component system, cell cycle sensor histidine kinase and response regulator CckA
LADLDQLARKRTAELEAANASLQAEATERRSAVQALAASEVRFAMAFGKSPLAMAIQSLEPEVFVDANEGFQRMLGYSLDEMIGQNPVALGVWVDPLAHHTLRSRLQANEPVRLLETRLGTRSGESRDVVLAAEKFEMNGATHVLLIAQDVTHEVELGCQVRQAQKMEAVGRLAAGVAHDFNNMLTIIQGHVHLLSNPDGPPVNAIESLEQIASVAERASRLTRYLLEFSRKQPMQPRALDLNHLLSRLNCILARLIGEDIEWQCRFEESLPLIEGDESSLEQVITQLVVNARDAMPEGGQLWISTSAVRIDSLEAGRHPDAHAGKFVCLSVSDTGLGMDRDTVVRIFEPFFTTQETGEGAGLGLSAAFGIIKQHQGWIEVVSQPGQGATFKVFLPAARFVQELRLPGPVVELLALPDNRERVLAA